MKKCMEISLLYISVPKIMNTWCTVPEIIVRDWWMDRPTEKVTHRGGHCTQKTWRYYPFTHVYHKWRSYVWFLRYKVWHMMYGSWDIRYNRQSFLSFLPLLPFIPFNDPENQNSEKRKKHTCSYYYLYTHVYHKWQSYDVWFLRHGAQQTQFFLVLDHFLPFHPYNNTETENFEKLKKMTGAIIILHKCTINDNHIMPRSWHMKHDRQNFYWFWVIFCPFTPLTTQKIKILKK